MDQVLRKKQIILTVISSLLTIAGFYLFDLLVFLSLIPFFYCLKEENIPKFRFLLGFVWGLVYFFFLCYWLINISLAGLIVSLMYLALYPAVFALFFRKNICFKNLIYISIIWVLLEALRSFLFTGFPWGYLGYALAERKLLIQIADITGAYGISFVILVVNLAGLMVCMSRGFKRKLIFLCILLVPLFLSFFYGNFRLERLKSDIVIRDIALVQTNIDSDIKWDLSFYEENFERFKLLLAIAKYKSKSFIVFPETILPYAWNESSSFMREVKESIKEVKLHALIGLPYLKEGKIYNSSIFFSPDSEINGVYFKNHLVPFGEYVPLKRVFSFIEKFYPVGSYSKGEGSCLFNFKGYPFSVLVCYEDIFPQLVRKATIKGAWFLINQSDEGWFGKSQEAYLHNQIAVFRAIENRRSIIRATNTGITCLIDYKGRILSQLDPFKADVLIVDVPIYKELSFYSKYGWMFIWILLIGMGIYLFKSGIRRNF